MADEEATTDIEDHGQVFDSEMTDDVAADTEEEPVVTPVKEQAFIPASPPASGRATRQTTAKSSAPPPPGEPAGLEYPGLDAARRGKKRSPFDSWQRSKPGAEAARDMMGKGKKREGEVMERNDGTTSKRVRSGAA